jgi:DNA/RNA-binding protein KIN17
MPKAEVGSIKHLANKMKAKGLQKLRWYCQACQKQCRDENGFKSHINSESHQRKMLNSNPGKFVEESSKEFMNGFISILHRRYKSTRVFANKVYQEYISDRHHLHMNATRWATLTEFVLYLNRRGLVKADETEKGWFITWVDNSPQELARQDAIRKLEASKKDQEERDRLLIEEQIKRGLETEEACASENSKFEFKKDPETQISFQPVALSQKVQKPQTNRIATLFSENYETPEETSALIVEDKAEESPSKHAEIVLQNESIVDEGEETPWITRDIVVKVLSKKLGGGIYFEQKGRIIRVIDHFIAEIEMFGSGDIIRLDQAYLETVIPKIGGKVVLLKGPLKERHAELVAIDEVHFNARLKLDDGDIVQGIEFEWFSKSI